MGVAPERHQRTACSDGQNSIKRPLLTTPHIDGLTHELLNPCHEEDQKPVLRAGLGRGMDRGAYLVSHFRHIHFQRECGPGDRVARARGYHGVSTGAVLSKTASTELASQTYSSRDTGPERTLPMRLRKKIQTLLRRGYRSSVGALLNV